MPAGGRRPAGPPLHRAPGQVLCGLDRGRTGHGLGLLAVGHTGTRLRRLPATRLPDLAADPETAADLAARLDGWLGGLFGEISRAAASPKAFEELRPGAETCLEEAGRAARPREGVAWVRHLDGSSRPAGRSAALSGGRRPPARAGGALAGQRAARPGSPLWGPGDLLREDGELWQGLARFHDLCLGYVALQIERAERQERERLGRKVDLDRSSPAGRLRPSRLRARSRVLRESAGLGEASDPLLAACRLVGQAQGIVIRAQPEWQSRTPAGGPSWPRSARPRGSAPAG